MSVVIIGCFHFMKLNIFNSSNVCFNVMGVINAKDIMHFSKLIFTLKTHFAYAYLQVNCQ